MGRQPQTCEHGISPKNRCKPCRNEASRVSMLKNYSAEKYRAKYLADQDAQIVRNQNGRAKRLGAPGTIILEDWLRKKALGCVYCGTRRFSMHIDHRIPLSRGGTNEPDNIQAACAFCNRAKQDLDEAEFIEWLEAVTLLARRRRERLRPKLNISFRWEPAPAPARPCPG